jgi:hypothetical protein
MNKPDAQVIAEAMGRTKERCSCSFAKSSKECPYICDNSVTCFTCEYLTKIEVLPDFTTPRRTLVPAAMADGAGGLATVLLVYLWKVRQRTWVST